MRSPPPTPFASLSQHSNLAFPHLLFLILTVLFARNNFNSPSLLTFLSSFSHSSQSPQLIKNMKFLSSSSSSASSTITTTTATSFDANVHNSKSATAGCIAGVFRRLLCLNSLPTYPSDHFRETDHDHDSVEFDKLQCVKAEEKVEASATPNIVARLMGLEILPQIDLVHERKSSNSISRSRSMNSVDSLKELQSIQGRHRRVKSFRETPTFLELEDENFLILSFENGAERRKLALKGRKPEVSRGQMTKNTRRESVYGKNKENQDANNVSDEELEKVMRDSTESSERVGCDGKLKYSSNVLRPRNNSYQNSLAASEVAKLAKPTIHKPESERGRRRMKKRKDECLKVKKIETESDSENSSPNSVLDNIDFSCDPEVTSSGEVSRLKNSKTRRILTEELENYKKLNLLDRKSLISNACKSKSAEGNCVQPSKKYYSDQRYVQVWGEICILAEKDAMQSSWEQNKIHKFEDYKEITRDLELEILDQLLGELVDQLPGNFHENFDL